MQNPEKLQGAMKKIIGRLQEKFQRGQFKPQDLVAEAEEMMKEFSENPAFVEMMESMRSTFGFEDLDMARSVGREGSARLNIAQQRLRREMARRTGATAAPAAMSPEAMAAAIAAAEAAANELLASETKGTKKSANKKR
jgi:heterodisulfide reductase subunit A-like polyferredoxin